MKPTKENLATYFLSPEQIRSFYEKGFVVVENLFLENEVKIVASAFDRLLSLAKQISTPQLIHGAYFVVQGQRVDRIVWCGAAEPLLLDFSLDHRLTGPVSQLLGSKEMQQLICQAHFKNPKDEVSFDWHQDSEHRRYGTDVWKDVNGKGSFVQCIMAVDPMTEDNGPLLVIPGTSKLGHLEIEESNCESYKDKAVTLTMEPGSVLFLHPYTIHGSEPNSSSLSRRVFINGYAYPGANTRIYPGEGSGRIIHVK